MKKQIYGFLASFAPPVLVLALLSALFWGPFASYLGMTAPDPEEDQQVFLSAADVPGDGFETGDACGFLMGSGAVRIYRFPSVMGAINFSSSSLTDIQKACVTTSGDFYASGPKKSRAYHGVLGVIDFAWSTTSPLVAEVNMSTGELTGFAKFTAPSGGNPWIWFDYDTSSCSTCGTTDHVFVDLETGELSGYAWSPYLDTTYGYGYISFNGVTMELPPQQVNAYVDVFSVAGDLPSEIDRDNAPMADGLEYYRVRVQFQDVLTGDYLTESDIASLSFDVIETADSNVYINQVLDTGDAITETGNSDYVTGCGGSGADYCVMTEPEDGSTSFNYFITSASPTSDMLYVDNGEWADVFVDRPGCIAPIYPDQTTGSSTTCSLRADKKEVYYSRTSSINEYVLDGVQMEVEFATGSEVNIVEGDFVEVTWGAGSYYMHDVDEVGLSFRPRFATQAFTVDYDGVSYTAVSIDEDVDMNLNVQADILEVSDFYRTLVASAPSAANPQLKIYYQTDINPHVPTLNPSDKYLLLDTDADGNPDARTYAEKKSTMGSGMYSSYFGLGYGQTKIYTSSCAGTGTCEPSANEILDPTVEIWVCDKMTENTLGTPSCYYGGYVDILDRHVEPYDMSVVGSISSTTDATGLFSGSDLTSVLGTLEVIEVRNKMYAVLSRYVSGQSATGGTIRNLDAPESTTPGVESLMNDRLIFAEGDVTLTGDTSFVNKTLFVKGGDVYIDGNIGSEAGGRLGVVVFSSGGVGGNVYIGPDVTELYVNFFLDGTLFSYDGDPTSIVDGVPTYASTEARLAALNNQLYINGNVTARYTIGGAADSTAGSWELGNGLSTSTYSEAREYDLNLMRQYRLCYEIDATTGALTSNEVECEEGEMLSTYGEDNSNYSPLIVEYSPPTNLPGFVSEGLFN